MKRPRTDPPRRARRRRAYLALGLLAGLVCRRAAAEPELALWAAPSPSPTFCDGGGPPRPAPLYFALPLPKVPEAAPGQACDGALPQALPPEVIATVLGKPLAERARYLALYADGHTAPVEVLAAARHGGEAFLIAAPACGAARPPGAAPATTTPSGAAEPSLAPVGLSTPAPAAPATTPPVAPDGGAPAGAPACAPEGAPPLALLLRPAEPGPPRQTDGATLSGVVRRRIGRKSLPARAHLVGPGFSIAAIFERRADAIPLAIFGEDGALRLYQAVPWRKGKRAAARPTALFIIPDLGGAGQDGLLLLGAGDAGPLPLLLGFSGKTVRAYP